MRGEPVNIDSIGKTIEDEINNLGDRFSKGGQRFSDGAGRSLERGIDRFFHFLAELFRGFFTVLGKVIGVAFIFVGVATLFVLLAGMFGIADIIHLGFSGWDSSYSIYEMGDLIFASSEWLWLGVIGFIFTVGIPFIALAYGGLVLLFPNLRVPYLGASLMGLWFLGQAAAATTGLNTAGQFSKEETVKDVVAVADLGMDADTLILEVGADPFNISEKRAYYANNDLMMKVEDGDITVGNVSFDIRSSKTSETLIELQRKSHGESYEEASVRAESIQYSFRVDSNIVTFDPYFTYPEGQLLRGQEVDVIMRIPVGKTVFINGGMKRIIDDIDNVQNMYDPRMVNHYWQMTEEGLNCLECIEESKEAELHIEGTSEDGDVTVDINITEN